MQHISRTAPRILALLAAFLGANASAADSENPPTPRRLSVGESTEVEVIAKKKFNHTGLTVSAGDHYSFVVATDAKWKDLTIVCDANGWLSEQGAPAFQDFLRKAEKNRRVPAANWFELAGTIDQNEQHHFQIGLRGADWTHTVESEGELFLFANDLIQMYGNNHDSIRVTVTRQATPAKNQLPKTPAKP